MERVSEQEEETPTLEEAGRTLPAMSLLLALGWLGTNLGYSIADLPFKFLLKD
jgi:hypothetical protein